MQNFTLTRVDGSTLGLPVDWYVERYERDNGYDDEQFITFNVFQEGGSFWTESGEPRPELAVELTIGGVRFGQPRGPEVSWPSTSDKRPELARALAAALQMAADEAEEVAS
jgi:hypothetical protein